MYRYSLVSYGCPYGTYRSYSTVDSLNLRISFDTVTLMTTEHGSFYIVKQATELPGVLDQPLKVG